MLGAGEHKAPKVSVPVGMGLWPTLKVTVWASGAPTVLGAEGMGQQNDIWIP